MPQGLNEYQSRVMSFYAAILTANQNLNEEDRADLAIWEQRYAPSLGTSSWPRWKEFIPECLHVDFAAIAAEPKKSSKVAIPSSLRWQVWERDNFTCLHCGSRANLSVDHIQPESKGGILELSNLQTLCKLCNSRKGAR